jgi:hypothetical protein
MFKFKLFRKFLILAVLTGGLFLTSSINQTGAAVGGGCCLDCDGPHFECVAECQNQFPQSPQWQLQCIQTQCLPLYHFCLRHCDPSC